MTSLRVESWLWYAVVLLIAISRFVSRRMTLGSFRRFQSDDYGMVASICFYTLLIATINIVRNTNSNLLPPGFDVTSLTPNDKANRSYGSKLILVVEQSQCVTIWGAKLCLLLLYNRLTTMRWENIGIKILIGYVILSFLVMEILYFGVWCRPFSNYWAVPTPNVQCDAATNHLITNATFNLTSDVIMLIIGLPMFLRLRMPWQKKAPLIMVFSLGIFVILAAVLNKVYSFTQPFGSLWTFWYVRESSTALLVANLPFVWGLWRKIIGFHSGSTRRETIQSATAEMTVQNDSNNKSTNSMLDISAFLTEWEPKDTDVNNGLHRSSSKPSEALKDGALHDRHRLPKPPLQRAVTIDVPARETVRRDSDPERRSDSSPLSSKLPSMQGSWSAGSFV